MEVSVNFYQITDCLPGQNNHCSLHRDNFKFTVTTAVLFTVTTAVLFTVTTSVLFTVTTAVLFTVTTAVLFTVTTAVLFHTVIYLQKAKFVRRGFGGKIVRNICLEKRNKTFNLQWVQPVFRPRYKSDSYE